MSTLVWAEAMWVLGSVYELTPSAQATAVEMLLDHRDLVLQDRETVEAGLSLFRARPALGFSECVVIESARKAGHLPLGTFDWHLSKVDGA